MATAKILDFPLSMQQTTEVHGFEIACDTPESQRFRLRTSSARMSISQYIRDKSVKLWESVTVCCDDDGENLAIRVVITLPDRLKPVEISLLSNPAIDAELPIVCRITPHVLQGRL